MKAIEKLIELRKKDPSIVAIAKQENGDVHYFRNVIPEIRSGGFYNFYNGVCFIQQLITFDSDNWEECIVTYKDLESYEVKMMSISVQDYERLIEAEKKLKEIQKFFT